MTAFPAAGYLNNNARLESEMKSGFEDFLAATKQLPGGKVYSTLTIASGSITPVGASHPVDTESAAASDDLTNIATTNMPDGSWLIIRPVNSGHDVVVKHNAGGAGQIALKSALDFTMTATDCWLMVVRNGTDWEEVIRNNGKGWYGNKNGSVVTSSGAYTMTKDDDGKTIDISASGGAVTQNLTAVATLGVGFEITFKKSDSSANTVTLDANSSENIDDATTYILYVQDETVTLVTTATGWRIKSNKGSSYIIEHTFTVQGTIAVASGATDFIPGMFIRVRTGYKKRLVGYEAKNRGGTNAGAKLQINGSDVTGFTGLTVTTTLSGASPTPVNFANNDYLALIINSVSGSPDNMSFTVFIEEYRAP